MVCVWDLLAFLEYRRWQSRNLSFTARHKHSDHFRGKSDLETVLTIYCIALHYFSQFEWQITGFAGEEMDANSHCQKRNCDFRYPQILIFPQMCENMCSIISENQFAISDCHIPLHLPKIIVQPTLLQMWSSPESKCNFFSFRAHNSKAREDYNWIVVTLVFIRGLLGMWGWWLHLCPRQWRPSLQLL